MLESGTGLPDSFAARFNCSLSLTRLRKSERHLECLTKENKGKINFNRRDKGESLYCVQFEH